MPTKKTNKKTGKNNPLKKVEKKTIPNRGVRRKALPGDKRLDNAFWQLRSKHGRDKLFETPQLLWEAACEYFQWCVDNPLPTEDFVSGGPKAGKKVFLNKMRAFTIQGLCRYLDCNSVYFNQFEKSLKTKSDETAKGFSQILTRIRDIIYEQKFTGAASGLLNASIIARDLGLRDSTDLTTKGDKINRPNPINLNNVPLETLLELAKHIDDREDKE